MDVICVLGRGIEKVKTSSGWVWRPTRFIERLSEEGWHTGFRSPGLESNDESAVIAGGNANVLACIQLFEELSKNGNSPRLVIFAAGRPAYLADDPDSTLSEGKILSEKFVRRVKFEGTDWPEISVLSGNKNTKDDLEQPLNLTLKKGLNQLAFITVSVHIDRVKEFYKVLLRENPFFQNIHVGFFASENILLRRYRSIPLYEKILIQIQNSKAYRRTIEKELKGIESLRAGTYDFSSQGYEYTSSTS